MPTYEYQCPKCSLRFEAKRSFSDNSSPVFCTRCGAEAKRLFSAVPVIFKGPGFYVTDTRAKSEGPVKKDEDKGK